MFISDAMAQGAGGGSGDLLSAILPLVLIFVVFWFLLIRPQQKRQKEHQAKLSNIRRGDRIITGGGIYGQVAKITEDNELMVEVAEGVRLKIARATVMDVVTKPNPASGASAGGQPANDAQTEKKGGFAGLFGRK